MNIFNRPKHKPAPDIEYRLAPFASVNGGAEEFAFMQTLENPVYSFRGPARIAGQFLVFGSGPARASLYPQGAPQGIPQVTGDFLFQNPSEIVRE